jgi:hypothetical protein
MAQQPHRRGSLLYEILIIVFTIWLILAIVLRKIEWDEESRLRDICRARMQNIYKAELQYIGQNAIYTGNIDELINFAKTDPTTKAIKDSIFVQKWDEVAVLDSMRICPANRLPYRLVAIDTSVIKYVNIFCPFDTSAHGFSETGKESWVTTKKK